MNYKDSVFSIFITLATLSGTSLCLAQSNARSADLVCRKWIETQNEAATERFEKPLQGKCDEGVLDKKFHQDAVDRTNSYRWFAGLPPVSVDWSIQQKIQKAAFLMAVNPKKGLSHTPKEDENWDCWSKDAAWGASKSNLGHFYFSSLKPKEDGTLQLVEDYDAPSTAADSVDGVLKDNGPLAFTHVLHRGYMLSPRLKTVAFGNFNGFNAMYVDLENKREGKSPIIYPVSGPSPYDMFKNFPFWSFSHLDESLTRGNSQMIITDVDTKERRTIPGTISSYGAIAFQSPDYGEFGFLKWGLKPETVFIKANHKYQVEVVTEKCKWTYLMAPIECKLNGNSTEPISAEIKEDCK